MRMGHIKLAHPLLVIYSFNDLRISTQVYELRFTGFFVKLVRPQVKTCWCVGLVEFPVQWVDADVIWWLSAEAAKNAVVQRRRRRDGVMSGAKALPLRSSR